MVIRDVRIFGIILGVVAIIAIIKFCVYSKKNIIKDTSIPEDSMESEKEYFNIGVFGNKSEYALGFAYSLAKTSNPNVQSVDASQITQIQYFEFDRSRRHYAVAGFPDNYDNLKDKFNVMKSMDAVIINISENDLVPKTIEKFYWSKAMGVPYVIFYIWQDGEKQYNDMYLKERLEPIIKKCGYDSANSFILGGYVSKDKDFNIGLHDSVNLIKEIDKNIKKASKDIKAPFVMPVDDIFNIAGKGTVVTGMIEQGVLRVNDQVELIGFGIQKKVRVNRIEIYRNTLNAAYPGNLIGAVLDKEEKDIVKSGMVLSTVGSLQQLNEIEASIYVLNNGEGGKMLEVKSGDKCTIFTRLCSTYSTIETSELAIKSGTSGQVKLYFDFPMVMPSNAGFIVYNEFGLVAVGVFK